MKSLTFSATLGLPLLLATPASADLQIYEPFDYADTSPIGDTAFLGDGNQAGGLGLGEWRQAISGVNELEVIVPGLTFMDEAGNELPSLGGYAYRGSRVGQTSVSSDVDSSATAALTADNSTMWMSFLYVDRGFSGPDSAIAFASEDMVAADSQDLVAPGFGVGVAFEFSPARSRSIATAYFNGATSSTKVLEATPTFGVDFGPENEVFLFALKVNWKPDGELDEIFVFNITDLTTEPDEADALASDSFDMLLVNQQSLDVLNIGETQIDGFDEVRLGNTFADVVGGGSPAGGPPQLTIAPSASTEGAFDFSWNSREGKIYDLVSATDLSSAPFTWAVFEGQADIPSAGETTAVTDLSVADDAKRFFALVERDAPAGP